VKRKLILAIQDNDGVFKLKQLFSDWGTTRHLDLENLSKEVMLRTFPFHIEYSIDIDNDGLKEMIINDSGSWTLYSIADDVPKTLLELNVGFAD
jgi:hypothetical protein